MELAALATDAEGDAATLEADAEADADAPPRAAGTEGTGAPAWRQVSWRKVAAMAIWSGWDVSRERVEGSVRAQDEGTSGRRMMGQSGLTVQALVKHAVILVCSSALVQRQTKSVALHGAGCSSARAHSKDQVKGYPGGPKAGEILTFKLASARQPTAQGGGVAA